jgi:tRNA (guanine-N7-)-methyltransferase
MFAPGEIDNIFIHFPDPWTSPRKPKNRILNPRMLDVLWELQRPGSILDFKTDSQEAFLWSLENIPHSKYKLLWETRDLHKSGLFPENVITQFEKIFLAQGLPIYMLRLARS